MAYGVATGEIVPSDDAEHSPQCDIIIYDQLHFPILGKEDAVQLIPRDAVYAVIEVKTTITGTELTDAEKKFTAIRKISSSHCESSRRNDADSKRRDPVFVVFGYQLGMTRQSALKSVAKDDPDYLLVALDEGIGLVLEDKPRNRAIWMKTTDEQAGRYETLAWLFCLLLELMPQVEMSKPNFAKLIFGE